MSDEPLPPDTDACTAYGALTEGVHIAGYTFDRAFGQLMWLLEEDRWQRLGQPFEDVHAFLASIKLDEFRIKAERRQEFAERIRELQPEVRNRTIAGVLGVSHQTIYNDARVKDLTDAPAEPSDPAASEADAVNNLTDEPEDEAAALAEKTLARIEETGQEITSIADLKKAMTEIWREDHPPPEEGTGATEPAPPTGEPAKEDSHIVVDTFGIVRNIIRHAGIYSVQEAADEIDKWTRLNILDDISPAIDYLTELRAALIAKQQEEAA